MRIFLILFVLVLVSACTKDDAGEMECTMEVEIETSKIAGGSILQVFTLAGNNESRTDIVEKTNINYLALSPLISLSRNNNGDFKPFTFPVSAEKFKVRRAVENSIASGINNIMLKPLTSFAAISNSTFWGDFFLDSEEEWLEMERAYTELFLEFASLSEEFDEIRMLSVGNELREFATRRPDFFKGLISKLQEQYPDLLLTYSSNWDEYERITFWSDLDYIGVNSYFPLIDKQTPTVDKISRAFEPIKLNLIDLSCREQKPVLFTEYGFRSIDFVVSKPFDLGPINRDKVNLEAQANAYKAFYSTFWDEAWVAGGFYWEWFSEIDINSPAFDSNENGWYVNGKPAQDIVRDQYSKK